MEQGQSAADRGQSCRGHWQGGSRWQGKLPTPSPRTIFSLPHFASRPTSLVAGGERLWSILFLPITLEGSCRSRLHSGGKHFCMPSGSWEHCNGSLKGPCCWQPLHPWSKQPSVCPSPAARRPFPLGTLRSWESKRSKALRKGEWEEAQLSSDGQMRLTTFFRRRIWICQEVKRAEGWRGRCWGSGLGCIGEFTWD